MSEQEKAPETAQKKTDSWELWAQVSLMMAGIAVLGWLLVFLRLGIVSVYIHMFVVPTLGFLTLPIMFWGLTKTIFNRPILRRSRTTGFLVLVGIALFCNVPMFTVPLSTEDWESTHTYRLPFDGEWVTTAGGDTTKTNYHGTTATYRWGYDFALIEQGKRFQNDGEALEDHYCFGQPLFASAPGEVIQLERKHEDNAPVIDENAPIDVDITSPLGNHVVIKVDEDEFLYVAHLKHKSIPLKVGQKVVAGEKIGECGNSGGTRIPHVHIHLQNTAQFPIAESLPLRFSKYLADGEAVDLGMPVGSSDVKKPFGQRVESQAN